MKTLLILLALTIFVPDYSGSSFYMINNSIPSFSESELETYASVHYGAFILDRAQKPK